MASVLPYLQIVTAVILSFLILIQVRGTGFGRVWGGLSHSPSRRGLEELIFKLTFVIAGLFLGISAASLFL